MKKLKSTGETRSKGVWQIIIAILPLLLTGFIMESSSPEGGAMVGAFLLSIFSIPCLVLFILGIKNLYLSSNKKIEIGNNQTIENKWLILSIKIISWITLITFSPLLFSININFNSLCVIVGLGLSLYILVFKGKGGYVIILSILIILYGYIFYEMYQSGCLCLGS